MFTSILALFFRRAQDEANKLIESPSSDSVQVNVIREKPSIWKRTLKRSCEEVEADNLRNMFEAHNRMPICRIIQVEVVYESQHMIVPHPTNASHTLTIQTHRDTLVPCESLPIPAAYTASLTGSTAVPESAVLSTSQIPELQFATPLDPAVLTVNRFRTIKRLGRGGFGQVFLVQDKLTNRAYALKAMKKPTNKTWMWNIFEEKLIMQKCQGSPWLLGLKGSFCDKQYAYILMDYQAGGDMYQKWVRCGRRMSVHLMRVYAAGTIYALGELHKRRIIHRDIKLENVFLDDEGEVVLADFGIAKIFGCSAKEKPWEVQAAIEAGLISDIEDIVEHVGFDDLTRSPAGTPGYISPEGLQQRPYSYSSDVWSLGVVFHILLLGRPPFGMVFGKMPASELNEKTLQGILMFTKKDKKSMGVLGTDMLTRMLQRDPKERITIDELKKHPFFEGVQWADFEKREVLQAQTIVNVRGTKPVTDAIIPAGQLYEPAQVPHAWFDYAHPELQDLTPVNVILNFLDDPSAPLPDEGATSEQTKLAIHSQTSWDKLKGRTIGLIRRMTSWCRQIGLTVLKLHSGRMSVFA